MMAAVDIMALVLTWPVRVLAVLMPTLLAAFLVVIANLPVSFTGGLLPAPALALAAIYFWAMARPSLMPPFIVLSIGLLEDLLSGGPPGLWASGFIAAYVLVDRQRKNFAGLNGSGTLIAFAGAMLVAAATAYVLATVVYMRWAPLPPLLLESITTIAFYPLVARPMVWVNRRIGRSLPSGV